MNDSTARDIPELLQEPYWSLNEIIHIAIAYKFPDTNESEDSHQVKEFKLKLLKDVVEAIFARTIVPVDLTKNSNWKDRYTQYIQGVDVLLFILFLYIFAYYSQKFFEMDRSFEKDLKITYPLLNSVLDIFTTVINKFDVISVLLPSTYLVFGSIKDPLHAGQDVILSLILDFTVFLILAWLAFVGYMFFKKLSCNTVQDRIDSLMTDAKFRGLTDNQFISDNAIDFLNMKYSMHIPKDPFRVWKEPFLKRSGEIWFIGFMGKRISIRHYIVLEKIAYLLAHPNKEIPGYELNKPDPINLGNTQKPITGQDYNESDHDYTEFKREKVESKKLTKQVAEKLLKIKKDDLMEAKECNQLQEILQLQSEIKMWERYIDEIFTRRGSERPPSDDATKDSENLKREINRFIKTVHELHPSFSDHLKFIKKEPTFIYRPPDNITWDVRF